VAEVRRAEAQLARVQDQIAKTTITSPLDGRVVRRFVEVGSWVNPGSSVIEVMSLDPVLVRIAVNEKDISKVEKGNGAVVTVDSLPDKEFQGEVRFLVPEADSRSRSFPVLIEVPNPEEALMPGMFARVGILCGQAHEAFTVPKNAIVNTPQGAAVVVLGPKKVVAMGDRKMPLPTAQYVPVKTGISAGDRIEVRGEGLAPGVPVVTVGNESLMPGQPLIPSGGAPGGGAPGGGAPGGASGGGEKR
jgi:membrane fusion protein (multidrug efflux system)